MPYVESFQSPWWLSGGHLQTLWQPLLRHHPRPATRRERLITTDGDFLDLDWYGPEQGALVILLHGLSGSSRSPYIRGMQKALAHRGIGSVALNFRGCSGHPNLTARGYHSGETGDLNQVVDHLRRARPGAPLAAVGYSLGGNVLLKWLGERGPSAPLSAAVAVSVPLKLDLCATRLDQGWSRVYRDQLIRELKTYVVWKHRFLASSGRHQEAEKLDALGDLSAIRSFWEYDDRIVARLYGFDGAADYYRQSSSNPYLIHIQKPTWLIQARNDPFMTPAVLPQREELSPHVELMVTEDGGHVGFISGPAPWRPRYWLEERIPDFLMRHMG